ncbi:hypothetical protein [Mitsuaria sp. GD03876]|uniref:hypothetical protein n=1 Tax=Mitsuaria sp. GD03876 TaxID=2975399 RepID=UPI00244D35BA|nr:hypothetical protein [Mitsuaria sp. GD03876]MDH0863374.1 hypothetical protein [Mitsuaria sp. GD03876]
MTINPQEESPAIDRACENTAAIETPVVRLTGWNKGALTVSAIQAVRRHSSLGLSSAKQLVEACLDGERPVVLTRSLETAKAMASELASFGFQAEVCDAVEERLGPAEG